jgi:POT family proton-dependent oligopeptide transporter
MSEIVQTAAVETKPPKPDTGGIGGHPKGLTTLFFTELWERFSYYGMRAILILFMVAPASEGGLGFDTVKAASIYGTYTMSVYLTAVPGGFIADKVLGLRLAVLVGGIVIALGHFSMAYASVPTFYAGLVLIALGTGLLKPNISAMVGGLYGEDDPRRDGGFSIFYMGINIGATLAPLVCGYLAQGAGFKRFLSSMGLDPLSCWHWGFAAAGVGMTLGLAQYLAHRKRLERVGAKKTSKGSASLDAPLQEPLTSQEWKRIAAIFVLFVFSVLFWAVYEQAGSSFNLFADRLTRNEIFGWAFPSSWYQTLPAIFVIALAPMFAILWNKMGNRQPSSPAKFAYGLLFLGISVVILVPASMWAGSGKVSPLWLVAVYFIQVVGEMCLSPVGLSTVTKLAPVRLVGLMMGVWFLSLALGNKVAGLAAGFFESNSDVLMRMFGYMAIVLFGATLILAVLTPWVRKLMGKVH